MKIALIGAVAGVALVSVTAAGMAQAPGGADSPGRMPNPGASTPGGPGSGGPGAGSRTPGAAEPGMKEPGGKGAGETPNQKSPRSSESPANKASPKSTEAPPEKVRPKASEKTDRKDTPKSTETRPEKSSPKASETKPANGAPKSTETRPDKGQPKAAETQPGRGQAGRVQVTDQQRTSVRERLMKEGRFEKSKLNVRVNVGSRIPRSVRLLALPVAILELAPSYRGYSYIVLDDDSICIVEPRSYEVVDVIGVGTQQAGRPSGVRLSLSQEQMRLVSTTLPREPRTNVRVRLALGAEVPADVELMTFPRDVVQQVPDLENYRYIIAENDIVVVDPSGRGVALVISE